MLKALKFAAIVSSLVFVWTGPAAFAVSAASPSSSAKTSTKTKSSEPMVSDSTFAKDAAYGGFAEVKFGQLAEEKAASEQVKDFGKRMVTDHSKADDNLKAAASKDNISVSAHLDAKDQSTYDRLSKLSGTAFDRAYALDMVRDHVADIAAFRHGANDGKDASIKAFAAQTLPTLEDHLKNAREMLHSVSAKTSTQTKKQQS